MKKLIFITYAFLFSFAATAQNDTLSSNESSTSGHVVDSSFYLISEDGKVKKVNPNGYVALVKYALSEEQNTEGYPMTENYAKQELRLVLMSSDNEVQARLLNAERRTYQEGLVASSEQQSYFEESAPTVNLNLSEYQGVYYSSPRRLKMRNAFLTLSIASAFTALVLAPIASFEYVKGPESFNQYSRATYFGVLGVSAGVAAFSVPLYFVLKPKYYSFNGELLSRSNKRWRLTGAR